MRAIRLELTDVPPRDGVRKMRTVHWDATFPQAAGLLPVLPQSFDVTSSVAFLSAEQTGRYDADAATLEGTPRPNSTSQLRSTGAASPLNPSLGKSSSATLNASSRCG